MMQFQTHIRMKRYWVRSLMADLEKSPRVRGRNTSDNFNVRTLFVLSRRFSYDASGGAPWQARNAEATV